MQTATNTVISFMRSPSFSLTVAADTLLAWIETARQRRHLAGLDDRMLQDIGLSHSDVARECSRPFWR